MATKGVNSVTLVGNLGSDPQLRYTQRNVAVCNISLATSEVYKDQNGKKVEETEWHKVVVWGKKAEVVAQFRASGDQLYVRGKNKTRKWTDENGQDHYVTEVIVDQNGDIQLLGGKNPQSV
ncbi:single-stranded DNA-binding protein [Alteromonas sp. RKMC-009]|uniref:single-stranded DNA-binding protein n=1 Tax=Alteromonas sp. RKMC-009 TaxID=2267264 RepID=UPI0013763543|nr:single-stranded DNA-binding protein [Alteromonas sp. RKMC-009]